ncbi:unnamed protein product [Urochloa decumbens]|uniref:Phytocyanin domain-containing protein n=1 Tax=Urochloa decumbens TaxID=240449 RepID=A0ABC9FFW5_9POAL
MAVLRLAFVAATSALFLVLAASPSPPPAVQPDAGGETGLSITVPPAGNGTEETLTQWAERQRFHVGDVLDFKSWNGTVLLLARRRDYERCGGAGAAATRFAGGGATRFELDRPGTFYFASGVPGRCEAGQRMAVPVRAVGAPSFSIAPTSDVYRGDVTTAPPPTVVFKLTPSAWWWIGTTAVFLVLLTGVTCFCLVQQARLTTVFLDALGARVDCQCAMHSSSSGTR